MNASQVEIFRLRDSDLLKELNTSTEGLSPEEVPRRLAAHGPNSLQQVKGPSLLRRFARQFTHFLAILLWIAAGLSFVAHTLQPGQGMATLGWAIVGVILINALFTFIQEYKAERAVQALRRLLPSTAWVIRAGQTQQVPRQDLVPGDLLLLEEGEQVPADARLVEAVQMRVDNAPLTGEVHAKIRQAQAVTDSAAVDPLEAPNLVFAGTTVLSGHGRGIVYATGLHTEFGKIARLTAAVEPDLSPLQREIVRVTHIVAILAAAMGGLFFMVGVSTGMGFWASFIFAIGIIVANVPEGLLPTVTLALAMGSQRMAKRHALIKRLTSVETLGCATVICTDKTGTLTENRMQVEHLYVDGVDLEARGNLLLRKGHLYNIFDRDRLKLLFQAINLCNNAKRIRRQQGRVAFSGDPTEVALVEFAYEHGAGERERVSRIGELPFDTERKRMSTLHWMDGKLVAFVKGAPEFIVPLCSATMIRGVVIPMTPSERGSVLEQSRLYARQAYRVLAVATRTIEAGGAQHLSPDAVERNLTFLGLVALMDPPHREVPEAIARCRRAGVRVMMITGDHPLTALAVARKVGLVPVESERESVAFAAVIDGPQVDAMSDPALKDLLTPTRPGEPEPVFARMGPRHKMRIVSMLKEMGEVVAVTGDGVNDAPALQRADIGIAMGQTGTDVAKETADMILLNDNFATIVNAIEEGRAVYANIRKFVTYVLSSNVPEMVPFLGYGLFAIPLPLTVPQILAVDLGTDMLPALALGAERPDPETMEVPPRPRSERLLNQPLLLRAYAFLGLIEAGIAMGAFFWFLGRHGWTWGTPLDWSDPLYQQATTVTLAAIVVGQVANVFACRSERASMFRVGLLSNPFILWGIAAELVLLLLFVYAPFGNFILGTNPFPLRAWVFPILGALGLLVAEEIRKVMNARFAGRQT